MTSYIAWNATVMDHDNFELLMPRWGYVASAFVLFLIGFFGFFLNLMVILLMFKDRQLWTPLNIILFNLVCSDFSVSVLGNPFTLISALFHRWIFGHNMCVIYGFFMALLGITSITTLTVISFERYLLVTRPFSSRHLSSKGAVGSVVFIWTYSLALTTPPLMGWGNYVNEAANISCSVNWHEQSRNALTYILFLFAMGQMVPFAVISFSYLNIIRTMKKNSKRLRRVSRAESRATTMVFVMIVAFTVAWTPYSVFALMEQFATNDIISPGVGVIPALVAKSSICYNPLIYVGMNSQFRQSIKRLFGIHNDQNNSCTGRKHNQSSPAQKMTSTNDININFSDCTSTNVKKIERKFAEEVSSELTNDLQRKYQRDFELSTILENKHHLDNERSGENVFDEDSGHKNFEASNSRSLDDKSPILTIETDKISFSKSTRKYNTDVDDHVYGNRGFEDHSTDVIDTRYEFKLQSVKKPNITQSHSLDLSNVQIATKIRKLSIETKLETFSPKGLFKDNVINKIFDKSSKQNKNSFKSYLCSNDSEGDFL